MSILGFSKLDLASSLTSAASFSFSRVVTPPLARKYATVDWRITWFGASVNLAFVERDIYSNELSWFDLVLMISFF